jgi:hypothetical protein
MARRLADIGVSLFVGGHVLSGLIVLATIGQKRYAANLVVEWLGLGAAWIVLRELVAMPAWRSRVTVTLLAAATAAALFGIWQHQVILPQMARDYGPKIAAAREALARGETHPFQRELAANGIPTTEPGLSLYERRLRDSREPFGMFALANTLGGLLASALVWGAAALAWKTRPRSVRWWLGVTACLAMATCLIFTKSRTACVAAVVGLVVVGVHALSLRGWSRTRMMIGCGAGLAVAALVAMAAFAAGVWDREVLAEAPKSLGYRWLYWQGTGRLIAERPVLGVGLGQFRSAYLHVKRPEASEEIADPHNLILETWVNGGLVAVIGLLICVAAVLCGRPIADPAETADPTASGARPESSNAGGGRDVIVGGALAHVVVLAAGPWDDSVVALGLMWAFGVAIWTGVAAGAIGSHGALLTWGVHLLGAGGGGMPAVLLWGLTLMAMSVADSRSPPHGVHRRRVGGAVVAVVAGMVAVLLWRPDAGCQQLMAAGDLAARHGQIEAALTHYRRALDCDPWNPSPAVRLAEAERQLAEQTVDADRKLALLMQTPQHWKSASERDPENGHWDHESGFTWRQIATLAPSDDARRMAAEALHRAWTKSPTNAEWAADWADAAAAAGQSDDARRAAEIALTQDDINRRLGHVERWLSEQRRKQLEDWRDP